MEMAARRNCDVRPKRSSSGNVWWPHKRSAQTYAPFAMPLCFQIQTVPFLPCISTVRKSTCRVVYFSFISPCRAIVRTPVSSLPSSWKTIVRTPVSSLPSPWKTIVRTPVSSLPSPWKTFVCTPASCLLPPVQLNNCVRNTSEQRISTLLLTTASVLALPTLTEPPSTV